MRVTANDAFSDPDNGMSYDIGEAIYVDQEEYERLKDYVTIDEQNNI